jgi:metal-responsive CopG/Arc/MetJ family transcriptional regulator
MRVITFKAEDSLIDLLNTIAIRHKKSRSQIIREALEMYISEMEKGSKRSVRVKTYELK